MTVDYYPLRVLLLTASGRLYWSSDFRSPFGAGSSPDRDEVRALCGIWSSWEVRQK